MYEIIVSLFKYFLTKVSPPQMLSIICVNNNKTMKMVNEIT